MIENLSEMIDIGNDKDLGQNPNWHRLGLQWCPIDMIGWSWSLTKNRNWWQDLIQMWEIGIE